MEGFGKNLKFWGWYYLKTDSLTTLLIVGMVALTSALDGGGFFEAFFTMLPIYLAMMIVMEVIVFGFTSITVLFPFAVGMGAKRDMCIASKAVFEHIVFIVNSILAGISFLYIKPEYKQYVVIAIPMLIIVMAVLMIAGNLVALFSNKFGRTAGMIVYIVFVIACVFGLGFIVASDAAMVFIEAMIFNLFSFSVVFAVLALLLDALSVYLLYLSVKKKDLNFSV